MNFELKKINWEPGKAASQLQLMTLRIRKKSDEDEESNYTTIADDLQVYPDGTILNPPVIEELEEETNYVFRILNNDPAGGKFDMVFTTPKTFEVEPLSKSYYPNSEVLYDADSGFRDAMLPPRFGAYYSLAYTQADWFGSYPDAVLPGTPVWEKKNGQPGIKLQTEADQVLFAMDNAFLGSLKTRYALGVHFYVEAGDLPVKGIWPLISFGSMDGGDGVFVYVNCSTQLIHWRQQRGGIVEEIVSTTGVYNGGWNQILVFRANTISESQMWLNNDNTFTGALTTASVPNFPFLLDPLYVGAPGGLFSNFYYTSLNLDSAAAAKYQQPPYPVGILEDYYEPENKFMITRNNMIVIDNSRIVLTLPPDTPPGRKWFYIEDSIGVRPRIEVNVLHMEKVPYPLEIDFSTDSSADNIFKDFYYPMAKGWGGANGGVSPRHIYMQDGLLVLEAHGDRYDGNSQGYSEDGNPKYHRQPGDPQQNRPWTTRVGAVIASKNYYGYGRYVVEAKLPRNMGVAPSFWTSHYGKVHPQDPRYEELLAQGLHPQGSQEEGYYVVEKNEVDMELPGNNAAYIFYSIEEMLSASYHITWPGMKVAVAEDADPENNGTWELNNIAAPNQQESWSKVSNEIQQVYLPRKNNIKCSNHRGEVGTGNGITFGAEPFEDEYLTMLTNIGKDVWDDAFHEFRYDWYANRVEFYVDGEMIQVNRHFVPDVAGRWTIGLWFPSPPDPQRPWLTDPTAAPAGAVADWKYQKMLIKRMVHTPFSDEEAGGANRAIGETYPFDGLQAFPGPLPA
jgi:hypothetical protein